MIRKKRYKDLCGIFTGIVIYVNIRLLLFPIWRQKGGETMSLIVAFIISIAASIVAHYICKWLDGNE